VLIRDFYLFAGTPGMNNQNRFPKTCPPARPPSWDAGERTGTQDDNSLKQIIGDRKTDFIPMVQSTRIFIEGAGTVVLEKSRRARHVNITVRPFHGIRVAVPMNVSFGTAEKIARSRADWIKKHCLGMKQFEEMYRTASKNTAMPDRREAEAILVERVARIAGRHGYRFNRVAVRNQKTRWGSCSSRNNISLNIRLVLLPPELRDYIILHELVHTRVKNHGQDFWMEMLRVEPKAKELAARVKKLYIELI